MATANPTLPPGDSGDLITAALVLGVPHPPGYPLFTMLGHLFAAIVPVGTTAFRVNLLSVAADAIAVGLVATLIYRVTSSGEDLESSLGGTLLRAIGALVGAFLLAFSVSFWAYSLVAEVFALNNLFAAALLLFAVAWYQQPRQRRTLWAFFLTAGLASCNQHTIILLAPGLAVLLVGGLLRRRDPGAWWPQASAWRDLLIGIGFLLVGLLPYAYVPLAAMRDPLVNWGNARSLDAFVRLVTRADYGTFSLLAGGQNGSIGENLGLLGSYLLDSFGPAGCILALIGLWWLARRRPVVAMALTLCFLVAGPLFVAYANPDVTDNVAKGVLARFYILPTIPLGVMIGCGAFQVLSWVQRVARNARWQQPARAGAAIALLLLSVAPAIASYGAIDQSSNRMAEKFTQDLLRPLEPDSLLLSGGDQGVGVLYVQAAEHFRPDVRVIYVGSLAAPWYVSELRRRYPDLTIPFDSYVRGSGNGLASLVAANLERMPVYLLGQAPEDLGAYDQLQAGFARQLVPKGSGGDSFAFVRDNRDVIAAYQFPDRSYPSTTWEAWMSDRYSDVAFDLANALETVDLGGAMRWYREAIRIAPERGGSYRNLAILLSADGNANAESADLFEHYLQLEPNVADADAIRSEIARLRGAAP